MTTDQQRRERVAAGSKRQRDLAGGFRRSRSAWPKSKIEETHTASYHASAEDKERARTALAALVGEEYQPFLFNAALNLIAEGTEATPAAVRAEATAILKANDAFFAAQRERAA